MIHQTTFLHTHKIIYLPIHPSIYLSTYLSIYQLTHPSTRLPTYLPIHPSIYFQIHLPIHPSNYYYCILYKYICMCMMVTLTQLADYFSGWLLTTSLYSHVHLFKKLSLLLKHRCHLISYPHPYYALLLLMRLCAYSLQLCAARDCVHSPLSCSSILICIPII